MKLFNELGLTLKSLLVDIYDEEQKIIEFIKLNGVEPNLRERLELELGETVARIEQDINKKRHNK